MPQVRNKTLRAVKKNDRNKLNNIRSLYMGVYNSPDSLGPLAIELFHILGEVLEGKELKNIVMHHVPKQKVLEAYKELTRVN